MSINGITDVNLSTDNEAEGITKLNDNFDLVETHDHTTGKGNPITPSAISINENLDFAGNHAVNLGAVVLISATNNIVNGSLYFDAASGNLAVRDLDGNIVNIVKNGAIDTSTSGNITGLTGDAALTFYADDNIFEFVDDSGNKAKIDCKDITMTSGQGGSIVLTSAQSTGTNVAVTIPNGASTLMAQDGNSLRLKAATSTNVGTPASEHITIFSDSNDSNRPKYKTSDGTLTSFGEGSSAGVVGSHNFVTDGGFDTLEPSAFTSTGGTVSTATGTNALRGTRSIEWQGYASGNDLTFDEIIVIGPGYRGFLNISFRYTGGSSLSVELFDFTGKTGTEAVGNQIGSAIPMNATTGILGNEYATFSADIDIPKTVTQFKFRLTGTGSGSGIIFDDLGVSTDLSNIDVLIDTVSVSSGVNTLTLSKYNSSNDSPASAAGVANTNSSATLTEGTDYEDFGAEWIESITTASNVLNVNSGTSTTTMTYTITSIADVFDHVNGEIPVIDVSFADTVNPNPYGNANPAVTINFHLEDVAFVSDKLVIKLQATSSRAAGGASTTSTAGSAEFSMSATKTAGYIPISITTTPKKNVFSYQETVEQKNNFSARFSGGTSPTIVSQNSTFVQNIEHDSTGKYIVTFVTDFFSVIPAVSGVSEDTERGFSIEVGSLSTSGFTYVLEIGNSRADSPAAIFVDRQGNDYKEPVPVGSYFVVEPTKPTLLAVDEFFTAGTFTYTTPKDCVLLELEASGAGGGGAGGGIAISSTVNSTGGGSGEYGSRNITVLPETAYQIIIGAAGTGGALVSGTGQNQGSVGGETSFDKGNGLEVLWLGGVVNNSSRRLDGSEDFYIGPAGSYGDVGNGFSAYLGSGTTNGASIINPATYGGTNGKSLGGQPGSGARGVNTAAYGSGAGGGSGWVRGSNGDSTASSGTSSSTAAGGNGGAGGMVVKAYSVTKSVITS